MIAHATDTWKKYDAGLATACVQTRTWNPPGKVSPRIACQGNTLSR